MMLEKFNFENELNSIKTENGYKEEDLEKLRDKVKRMELQGKDYYLRKIDEIIKRIPSDDIAKGKVDKIQAMRSLARMVRDLIGDRSIRKTAEDTGVAASYITGILKEKYLPSAEILRKLASAESKPRNGVTIEDLMVIAGYQSNYFVKMYDAVIHNKVDNNEINSIINLEDQNNTTIYNYYSNLYNRKKTDGMKNKDMKFTSFGSGIIYKALADKKIDYRNPKRIFGCKGYKPDMSVFVYLSPINEWWFEFRPSSDLELGINGLKDILYKLVLNEPGKHLKISLVVNNKDYFDNICGYKDKLAYRGDLSVILINSDTFSVDGEVYLSHFELNDKSSEFYII